MPSAERQRTERGRGRTIAVTPDQIERRAFSIEGRGYDRDEVRKFLFEVAATLRLAQRSTMPPVLVPLHVSDAESDNAGSATFDRLSTEVTRILRAAEVSATERHEQADALAGAILEQAEREAEEIHRRAGRAAEIETEKAHRVLVTAQQQAAAIVAEAEGRAAAMLEAARGHARQHARQIARTAHDRADEVAAVEAETLRRLNQARLEVVAAMDALNGSRTAVVDLTDPPARGAAAPAPGDAPAPRRVVIPAADRPFLPPEPAGEARGIDLGPATSPADAPAAPAAAAANAPAADPAGPAPDDVDHSLNARAVSRAAAAAMARPVPLGPAGHDPLTDAEEVPAQRPVPVRPSVTRRVAKGGGPAGAARPSPGATAPAPVPAGVGTPAAPVRRTTTSRPRS